MASKTNRYNQKKTQDNTRKLADAKMGMLKGDVKATASMFNPMNNIEEAAKGLTQGIRERSVYANEVKDITNLLKKQQPKTKGQMSPNRTMGRGK